MLSLKNRKTAMVRNVVYINSVISVLSLAFPSFSDDNESAGEFPDAGNSRSYGRLHLYQINSVII